MPLIQYLIKLSISLGIIWLFYTLVLRRLTFYNWNRWYLLGYSLLAFYIPFIDLSQLFQQTNWSNNQVIQFIPVVEEYTVVFTNTGKTAAPVSTFTYTDFVLLLAATGSFILLVRLLIQYISFRRLKATATLMVNSPAKIYHVNKRIIPFSFGNGIFINLQLHEEKELEEIIKHEFIHVRQRHTADILWSELLCLLNWYNPFAWLIRKAIRQNLEFIADNKVLEGGINRKHYQYLLLKVIGAPEFSITHQFNFSSLKKRIAMMNKTKSARLQLIRFLFLLPLATVLLLAFRSIQQQEPNPAISTTINPVTSSVNEPVTIPEPAPAPGKSAVANALPAPEPNLQPSLPAVIRDTTPAAPVTIREAPSVHGLVTGITVRNRVDTTNPLYVIDGVPQYGKEPFKNLGPGDIEQITILKGKSATDVYGDNGKNGVVLITTRTKDAPAVLQNGEVDSVLKSLTVIKPLVVIDDVQYDFESFSKLNLSHDSIRVIFIYKNTEAIKLYGSKGANGVIKILTKKYKSTGLQRPKPYQFTAEQMKPVFEKAQRDHILYIGIDNPMQFSAAGINREDLVIDAGGLAEIVPGSNGINNIRTKKPGQVKIELYKKEKNGSRTLLNTQYYSSTFLPAPDKLLPMMVN